MEDRIVENLWQSVGTKSWLTMDLTSNERSSPQISVRQKTIKLKRLSPCFNSFKIVFLLKMIFVSICEGFGHCKLPIDIRDVQGMRTDSEHKGRAEYSPFPGGFSISPGGSVYIEFNSVSSSGLIMLAVNAVTGDAVSVQLIDGLLVFDRRCAFGRAHEAKHMHGTHTGAWHSVKYTHSVKGGTLAVDGHNPFRVYRLGRCSNLTAIYFAAQPHHLPSTFHYLNKDFSQFNGCLRGMRIDDKVPAIHPKYIGVSQC